MQTHLCALQYLEKGVAHRSVRRKEKMEKEYDVLVVGPVSLDHNIDYLGNERSEVGGAVVASGWAAAGSGAKAAIFCKLNPEEADVNERFEGIKADLYWKPSAHTCSIRNQYFTADKEKRACTSLGKCDPFRFDEMADIKTKMYHFAGLVYGDFDGELIRESAKHGKVAVDVQCMLRHVEPDKTMAFHDWADKKEILPLIDYLKTDAAEAEILTGTNDRVKAAHMLHEWGAKEVMISHNTELLVYDGEKIYTCPIKARNLSGRTGRGDTAFAGYINERQHASVEEALLWATALVSLKMETPVPSAAAAKMLQLTSTSSISNPQDKYAQETPLLHQQKGRFYGTASKQSLGQQKRTSLSARPFTMPLFGFYALPSSLTRACAAARRAIGTRNGEQET